MPFPLKNTFRELLPPNVCVHCARGGSSPAPLHPGQTPRSSTRSPRDLWCVYLLCALGCSSSWRCIPCRPSWLCFVFWVVVASSWRCIPCRPVVSIWFFIAGHGDVDDDKGWLVCGPQGPSVAPTQDRPDDQQHRRVLGGSA